MSIEQLIQENTIFLTEGGSHAYGTNTPESDLDLRGVCIIPDKRYYFGTGVKAFEQAERFKGEDTCIYNITKIIKLIVDNNPNCVELVFTDPRSYKLITPYWQEVIDNRDKVLSKKAKHTYTGYAFAQLKRIRRHRGYLLNPPTKKPERKDFGLPEKNLVSQDSIGAFQYITAHLLKDSIEEYNLSEEFKEELRKANWIGLVQSQIHKPEIEQQVKLVTGFSDELVDTVMREKRYRAAMGEWDSYQNWKKERNEKRQALESKYGYDCYLEDTEFLTNTGWKKYDDISEENLLATLNQNSGNIEFQKYFDRVKKNYSGKILHFETQDSLCSVTPNHRMFASEVKRSRANNFSTKYDKDSAQWKIIKAEDLISNRHSYYHIRTSCNPKDIEYDISDDILVLIGSYVSEGCVGKRTKDGNPSVLRFSQKQGGRLCEFINQLPEGLLSIYEIPRNDKLIVELVYTLADRNLATKIVEWCGEYSVKKHLPNWIIELSQRQAQLLLNTMISGDGTERKFSRIYYTQSKQLADDTQTLALVAGLNSKIWGPYTQGMYQVYISEKDPYDCIICSENSPHIQEEEVCNTNIVCFSVPNEILITRRKGKIAIQGNTKHAMHLVRLMRQAEEIFTQNTVNVYRQDREELISIRQGAWTFDQVVEYATNMEAKVDKLAKESKLPHAPNYEFFDILCTILVEEYIEKGK